MFEVLIFFKFIFFQIVRMNFSHHLPDQRREAAESIVKAHPCRQYHRDDDNRRVLERRTALTAGLC